MPGRFDPAASGEDPDVRANFEDAYRELDPAAARLLRLLSLPPGDEFGPAAAGALAGVPGTEARELLETLTARGLVTASGDRFRLPEAVRGHARRQADRAETEAERNAALHRLLDHALASATAGGEPRSLALLDRERWSEAAEVLEERLRDTEAGGDPYEILPARHDLARALVKTDELERAIELLGPLPGEFAALPEPDQHNRARALTTLGEAYLRAHRPVAAVNFFGQALEIHRKRGAAGDQAAMFVRMADAARQRADRAAEYAALLRAMDLCGPPPPGT
ncbi:hypothetical protein [Actinomadura formosensis]|uniref:hypothetical protein n=1 Tax=Actinomadura formosensis TaxID=60706 RepID=UPI003D8C083A